jgi:hypothetical protein
MTETIKTAASADNANSEFEAQRAAFDQLDAELQPRNKAVLFDALKAAGVTHVIVSFDGSGDSGQIENIEAKAGEESTALPSPDVELARAEWGKSEPQRMTVTIREAVEQLAYDFLTTKHSGWEDNEGAYGEFLFDVAARTITLDFFERFVDSAHIQHVF